MAHIHPPGSFSVMSIITSQLEALTHIAAIPADRIRILRAQRVVRYTAEINRYCRESLAVYGNKTMEIHAKCGEIARLEGKVHRTRSNTRLIQMLRDEITVLQRVAASWVESAKAMETLRKDLEWDQMVMLEEEAKEDRIAAKEKEQDCPARGTAME